ncbi:MAG: copper amine oxidase N-terminal domain-containing protein, partial [Armatimonadetes bacterium]|nr:copper amine oxidase N-terminal domain-containing protein [Armatimonadota bacterium]
MKRCNKFLTVLLVLAVAVSLVLAGPLTPSPAGATPPAAGQQGLIAADNPAEQGVKIQVDGKFLTFDVPPLLENGRTLVPLRALFENLGALVKWEEETRTVTAVKGDLTVRLTIGSTLAYVNDKPVTLDVPAKIVNGRTLIPVRFVSESLGAKVTWDAATRLVSVAT